mgnify:CR=1 FL=1
MIMAVLNYLDDVLYYPILMVILIAAGLIFSWKTRCVQLRLLPESIRVVMEKPTEAGKVSSFQALMVSTASRVGTGNIIGVSTAICLGGPGAVFWMWLLAIIGGATASSKVRWPRFTSAAIPWATATAARPITLKRPCITAVWASSLPCP